MLIDLNFLPLETSDFTIPVFRSKFNGEPKQDGYFAAQLPTALTGGRDSEYAYYRVGLSSYDGATPYTFHANENPQLMTSIMWYFLKQWAERLVAENCIQADIIDRYEKFISFIVEDLQKGQRVVKVYPYYLSATEQYGILLEFAFRKKPGVPFGREVQQLSYSLDRSGKSNVNSYLDRLNYIQNFINTNLSKYGPLSICGCEYRFSPNLTRLHGHELNTRTYIFGDGYEDYDKIKGIKTRPFAAPPKSPLFVFVFKESERNSGNELFRALIGKGYPSTFSGMKAWFDCDINTNNVTSITIDFDLNRNAVSSLSTQLENIIAKNPDKQLIGLFIDSYSHYDERSENYTKAKQAFFSAGIPLQVVRNDRIIQSDGLKWAISGIGLQVFSKLGGIPWKVKPSTNNCLIFGIGKAHDLQRQNGRTTVRKYFAYSVCFDSTGVYRSLGVLCDTSNREQYYADLERNIIAQIEERINAGQTVTDCVIHTPFRMRNDEMKTIKESIDKLHKSHGDITFTVMRINTRNRFFGFADNNIKIPYESTYVQLSAKEYLVWFEGLKRGREYINKRIANPTYIDFWYGWGDQTRVVKLLQDAVNLAGASWRGFNAKLEPISIFYPQLIAGFIRDFRRIGSEEDIGQTLARFNTPWFL
jgi:hypothetical protein